jgi:hypothetical protein
VTAGASLLDTSGRRIVVQDGSGAIELLLPTGATAPGVGARLEAIGRIGTAYGSPRLRATAVERLASGSLPSPLTVHGALSEAHAWRLVTIRGRIDDTSKLGERVRAEVIVGATRLVVVAQPGVGIAPDELPEGAIVEVTGIVRLAYPNATDRRPSLLPRTPGDVRVVGGPTGAPTSGNGAAPHHPDGSPADGPGGSPAAGAWLDADLIDLASVVGRTVRVGGLVQDLRPDGFTLDDGTAIGTIVLTAAAAELLPLVEPGDAINVIGRVEARDDGHVVVADDPAAVALGVDLGPTTAGAGAAATTASPVAEGTSDPTTGLRAAGFTDPLSGIPGAGAGLASLLLIAVASVAVTWLRRREARLRWQARVATRLAAIAGSGPAAGGPSGAVGPPSVG